MPPWNEGEQSKQTMFHINDFPSAFSAGLVFLPLRILEITVNCVKLGTRKHRRYLNRWATRIIYLLLIKLFLLEPIPSIVYEHFIYLLRLIVSSARGILLRCFLSLIH